MSVIADSTADCASADLVARIKELETARLKAMQAGQFEVALAAIREKGILSGVRPKERRAVIWSGPAR